MVSARLSQRFFQVDVFAPHPGAGNPLAVVFDGERFDSAQMQAIANWTNLAETTFVLKPTTEAADYRVRIFTTKKEIAFAGHPSIGTAHAVLASGFASPRDGVLVQECQAGFLPIRLEGDGQRPSLSVRVPRSRIVRHGDDNDALLRHILAANAPGRTPPALVEGGRRWWLAEFRDEADVRRFQPDGAAIAALAASTQSLGLCIFARSDNADHDLVVRAFPLGVGIPEDPASGAANAAIAAFLDESNALHELGAHYRVSQGREIGRDATLLLRIDEDHEVWVGGESRTVIEGRFFW